MEAYDTNGALVSAEAGSGNGGTPGQLEIFSESRLISYVLVYGTSGQPFAIDRFRWAVQGPVNDYVILNCGILTSNRDSVTIYFQGTVLPNRNGGEWAITVAQLFNDAPWGDEHVATNKFVPLAVCPAGPPCAQPVPPPCGRTIVGYKGEDVHSADASCTNWPGLGCLCTYPIFQVAKKVKAPSVPGVLSVVLDPHNEYPESDETNNRCDLNYTVSVPRGELQPGIELGPITPNPSSGKISYSLDLDRECPVDVSVIDPAGRVVVNALSRVLPAGHHVFSWAGVLSDGTRLRNGVYFFTLKADGIRMRRTMVVTR